MDTVSHPLAPGGRPLPLFRQQVHAWLSANTGLVHWWSPLDTVRDEAIRALVTQADTWLPARRVCLFQEGDFLALLQRLNGLLAAAQAGQSQAQAHAGQIWILDRAERVSAEHLDILRRICLHYPELQIHLALFSQTPQAPAAADGVLVPALVPPSGEPAHGAATGGRIGGDSPVWGHSRSRWVWALGGMLVVLSGLLLWRSTQGDLAPPPRDALAMPAVAGSTAASMPTPVEVKAPRPTAADVAPARTPEAPSPVKDGAVSASRRWALGLPPSSLAVVHVQVGSLREAEAFRKGKPLLSNARILQTSAEGAPVRFLVVTGPFRSTERAHNYMQRLEWKAGARSISREELLALVPR